MMVIYPQCTGSCSIDLRYEDDAEMRIAKIVQLISVLVCIVLCLPAVHRAGAARFISFSTSI